MYEKTYKNYCWFPVCFFLISFLKISHQDIVGVQEALHTLGNFGEKSYKMYMRAWFRTSKILKYQKCRNVVLNTLDIIHSDSLVSNKEVEISIMVSLCFQRLHSIILHISGENTPLNSDNYQLELHLMQELRPEHGVDWLVAKLWECLWSVSWPQTTCWTHSAKNTNKHKTKSNLLWLQNKLPQMFYDKTFTKSYLGL